MAKVEIQIKTAADLAALQKTTAETEKTVAAVNKLTEATDRQTKSAAESAKVFQEAAKSRNNATDQAAYLTGLTKEAKSVQELDTVTRRWTVSKKAALDGLKKLGQEVPIVGFALNALKNPFTIVGIGAAYAVSQFRDFIKGIDDMAEAIKRFGNAKITLAQFNEILMQGKGRSEDFVRALDEIANRGRTVDEVLGATNSRISRAFGFEREAAGNQKDKDLAAIDAQERSGRITPAQADAQRRGVNLRFDNAERERKVREEGQKAGALATAMDKAGRNAQDAEVASVASGKTVEERTLDQVRAQMDLQNAQGALSTFLASPQGIMLKELEAKAEQQKLTPGFQRDLERYQGMRSGLETAVGVAARNVGQAGNRLTAAQADFGSKTGAAIAARDQERSLGLQIEQQRAVVSETDAFYDSQYPGYNSRAEQSANQAKAQRRGDKIIDNNAKIAQGIQALQDMDRLLTVLIGVSAKHGKQIELISSEVQ